MTTLSKGQNAPLPEGRVSVTVQCAAPADLFALLVTDAGKVRSDADFVFYNQPDGPGVRCEQVAGSWRITVDPAAVPSDITQVRTVLTLADSGSRFGGIAAPVARLHDAGGAPLVEFELTGLAAESIVIALEIYRRGDAWKVRAVGQGYAGGFAALVRDHGVSVDDEPAAGPATAPPSTPPPSTPPPRAQPSPTSTPSPPASAPPWSPAAPAGPTTTGSTATGPATPPGTLLLKKGAPVRLTKGQKVELRKEDGRPLTRVRMCLGWDPINGRGSIDLDASAVLYQGTSKVDIVAFTHLRSDDGSITHSGDNLTGHGEGDDEIISVDLDRVPAQVSSVGFVVTSFQGQAFSKIARAFCRLVDDTDGSELVRFELDERTPTTAMVMAFLVRGPSGWRMQAVGQGISARLPNKAAKLAVPHIPVA
ncbi:stress protein [Nakamurella sp. YIM 132087]|uniref:Stress protein n=1 Tax=Nakamurella alba TaxID=2665158 RepID=A0A7K1FKT0_9ACTN|nr:TerD family protein [Nakamurella alba]MTD14757.1 stress protein [Nakamurella alba]